MRDNTKSFQAYTRNIRKYKRLTREEELSLGEMAMRGNRNAINMLVEHNLPLVIHFASKYQHRGMLLADLVAEGNIGLIKAAERYNINKKTRFSTYASIWIKQAIRRALEDKVRIVKIPNNIVEKFNRFKKADDKAYFNTGEHINFKNYKKNKFCRYIKDVDQIEIKAVSCETPAFKKKYTLPIQLDSLEQSDLLEKLIKVLTPKEKKFLTVINNFDRQEKILLKDIYKGLGLSKDQARHIRFKIKAKMLKEYNRLMEE